MIKFSIVIVIIIIIINFIYNALYIQESQSASEKKNTKKLLKRGNLKESLAKCSFKEMGFEVPFKKSCSLWSPQVVREGVP